MRIMAIDYGMARTGIAVCDIMQTIATPVCTLPSWNEEKLLDLLSQKIRELNVTKIIMGKPLRTDGKSSEMELKAKAFALRVKEVTGFEPELIDERFTTVIASRNLHDANKKAKSQRTLIDAAAAAVLLQGYIDSNK